MEKVTLTTPLFVYNPSLFHWEIEITDENSEFQFTLKQLIQKGTLRFEKEENHDWVEFEYKSGKVSIFTPFFTYDYCDDSEDWGVDTEEFDSLEEWIEHWLDADFVSTE